MPLPPRLILLLALGLAGGVWWALHREIERAPGVLAAAAPLQTPIEGESPGYAKGVVAIRPLAGFAITARVLSRADYHWGVGADIIPIDLALGWGRMSDSQVLAQLEISQGNRYFYWHTRSLPIPREEIIQSSANMHLIAADAELERRIARSRVGDIVSFDGFLVEARWPNGMRWISSLTRDDTGPGACELVYVQHFEIGPR